MKWSEQSVQYALVAVIFLRRAWDGVMYIKALGNKTKTKKIKHISKTKTMCSTTLQ